MTGELGQMEALTSRLRGLFASFMGNISPVKRGSTTVDLFQQMAEAAQFELSLSKSLGWRVSLGKTLVKV
ncbi:hypothetical protein Tsubulata_015983 [Turnera subulata]|uniref:Uncharacterized protein n=1 Tax=Turnera subulata TaxID=218843 RepID=A0A9Q0FKN6_9ROSI|nr:hypothetical protein Tsubulata_015983 [Turnera subulata]